MLNTTIKNTKQFKKLNKTLGISKGKVSTLYMKSVHNGLFIQVIDDIESILFSFTIKEVDTISDGSIALSWLDFIDMIDDVMSIVEENDVINIQEFPIPKVLDYKNYQFLKKGSITFNNKDAKIIKEALKIPKKEMKKSIFTESTHLLLEIKNGKYNIRHINPFNLYNVEIESLTEFEKDEYFYLDKLKLKVLETLIFKENDIQISWLEKDNEGVVFEMPDMTITFKNEKLNHKLFYPQFKIGESYVK